MKRFVAVLACAAALAAPAFATTGAVPDKDSLASDAAAPKFSAEPVFREAGLLGEWAVACEKPASPGNPHVHVTAPGAGLIVESHDVGPDFAPNLYHVVAARRLDKRDVEARALFRPGTEGEEAQTLVMRVGKDKQGTGTRRTMFNRGEDGDVRVRNGVAVMSGGRTAVLKRCG